MTMKLKFYEVSESVQFEKVRPLIKSTGLFLSEIWQIPIK